MSNPIKPPQSPPVPSMPGAVEESHQPGGATPTTKGSFGDSMKVERDAASVEVQASDSIAQLEVDVRTGRVTPEEAIDQMVERALQQPEVSGLSASERNELESKLRRSLEEDPTLVALRGALLRES